MNRSKLILVMLAGVTFLTAVAGTAAQTERAREARPLPPIPTEPFAPSLARTEDGKFIPVEQFIPSTRCASCHRDTHRFWSQSLHRNAAREPFYRESADILLRTRGIEFTRHCESCHTPVALFAGLLDKSSGKTAAPFTKLDDEGVTCSVCHSITEARPDGTGSFTIRRPALLAREDGSPVFGDFTDEQILADVPAHKRAVMRPLLRQPEFCSTCHKVDAPPSLNGYKHIRGFSAYDEWQQSGASHESLLTFYRRAERTDCRACHMPKVPSADDRAAKEGRIASHRWLGANTVAPLFYNQREQVEATKAFLQADVVDVDIFALRRADTGELIAPLTPERASTLTITPGEEVIAEVVVSNRNAAHTFPPEVRDLYEAWVQFEAIDEAGRAVFRSGFIKADEMLDESAHVYKMIILDESGRHITRHQIWTINVKAYDNFIRPGRSDVARFRFSVPPGAMTLRAQVNYRRLNQEYTNYVLSRQKRKLTVPIVQMAASEMQIGNSHRGHRRLREKDRKTLSLVSVSSVAPLWKRWNDYGIGLFEQAQYGQAADAFRCASELAPDDPNLIVNIALAEMKTERFGPERTQYIKAAALLERAFRLDPLHERARFYRALIWRSEGRMRDAAEELEALSFAYPRDREVLRELAQTRYAIGQLSVAGDLFRRILGIDPTDAGAYQHLDPIYLSEGKKNESMWAREKYLQWRDDPKAEAIAARFFAAHPEWADERVGAHVHGGNSALRPVLAGAMATPDK